MKKIDKYSKRDNTDKILCVISLSTLIIFILLFIFIIKDYNIWINDNIFFILLAILSLISLSTSLYFIIRLISKKKKHSLIITLAYSIISIIFIPWAYLWLFALAHDYITWWILMLTSTIAYSCGIVWILYCIIKFICNIIKYLYHLSK